MKNTNKSKIGKYLESLGLSMTEFARAEGIPLRTVQNWSYGVRNPAPWLEKWIFEKIEAYAVVKEFESMPADPEFLKRCAE